MATAWWARDPDGTGVLGTTSNGDAVRGTSSNGVGVRGEGATDPGVVGTSDQEGVFGQSTGSASGVRGESANGAGVLGFSAKQGGTGVQGTADNGNTARGVFGEAANGIGVVGTSTNYLGVFGQGRLGIAGVTNVLDGSGILGATTFEGRIVARPGVTEPMSDQLGSYVQFFHKRRELLRKASVLADVAVVRSFPSMMFGDRKQAVLTGSVEESLILNRVPFQILYDHQYGRLPRYRAAVLAGCAALSDRQIEQIRAYVAQADTSALSARWPRTTSGCCPAPSQPWTTCPRIA